VRICGRSGRGVRNHSAACFASYPATASRPMRHSPRTTGLCQSCGYRAASVSGPHIRSPHINPNPATPEAGTKQAIQRAGLEAGCPGFEASCGLGRAGLARPSSRPSRLATILVEGTPSSAIRHPSTTKADVRAPPPLRKSVTVGRLPLDPRGQVGNCSTRVEDDGFFEGALDGLKGREGLSPAGTPAAPGE
jgi:hypothetical protein